MNNEKYIIDDIVYIFCDDGNPIILDINKSGEIYIPSNVEINNKIYDYIGFSRQCFDNIKDKNITYFNVDSECKTLYSYNGILYGKNEKNELYFTCTPPKLNIKKFIIPKNHYKNIYFHNFSINNNINQIIIPKSVKTIDFESFFESNNINFISYHNKQLIKKNNKWIIK